MSEKELKLVFASEGGAFVAERDSENKLLYCDGLRWLVMCGQIVFGRFNRDRKKFSQQYSSDLAETGRRRRVLYVYYDVLTVDRVMDRPANYR